MIKRRVTLTPASVVTVFLPVRDLVTENLERIRQRMFPPIRRPLTLLSAYRLRGSATSSVLVMDDPLLVKPINTVVSVGLYLAIPNFRFIQSGLT